MPTHNRRKTQIDPAVIMMAGLIFLTVALLMVLAAPGDNVLVPANVFTGTAGQLMVAFVTGLTTGGLSCLAVQGGLLASSLAHQIEQDMLTDLPQKRQKTHRQSTPAPRTALPIGLFLLAKMAAYTLLGALLGWLGSFLVFSPTTRAILMILIGVFMLGNGLRMLNVHPIFRYFAIEPPKLITRYIRRKAKDGTDLAAPLFLGALTVFIPCGVTQAMMGAALATGSAALGAGLMFAFTLGTSPVFFLVAYLTTQIGARLESFFMRFVAIVVLVLGLVSLNSGLNLMGAPFSFENLTRSIFPPAEASAPVSSNDNPMLMVQNKGYFPQTLTVAANQPIALQLVTNKTYSCARDFVIPALGFYELLPDTGTVTVNIPPQSPGTRMFFTCSMGMYTGLILFE